MNGQVWLPLIRSSSPQTLGQAVLRLAALAEAAHMSQTTDAFRTDDATHAQTDGPAPKDVVAVEQGGRDHTGVDR
jgi:hypothetical protein